MKLDNNVFVVTGGGNGIGGQVVIGLLSAGARVAAVDLNAAALGAVAARANAGDRLTVHALDITDRSAVLALPDTVVAAHGQVDGLVNVAGIIHQFKPLSQLGFDDIERVMAVNFWGTVNTTKAFLPLLQSRPESALVNVASMGSLVPVPGQSAYGASKAAVKLFTEGLIAEHQGIQPKVSVVFPGGIATNILGNSGITMPGANASASAVKLTSPEQAARQIIDAVRTGRPRVVIGQDARALDRLGRLAPTRAIPFIAAKMRDLIK
ncbi:short-chain dehydrogenase [Catellatospora sp. TT07R-123]|uniref:SDR family NAD(P)-dependent oxidoreductase n=1 Tax=Catellatospora sp. TT07R-123 TaxID=2733863 RepID=UPI001B25D8CE|nr:SDR family NAD(P)-dependent oxidoreductase [Catellatospora sp. TT07R-123]GHJ47304.1 short-chain dehydrogenase [Catellatospora sp. TT07R-123]